MMLSGSSTQVFVMPADHVHHLLAGGAGGGGDEPRNPSIMKSVHELDAVVPAAAVAQLKKRGAATGYGPFQCPICEHTFTTEKAVHGHMRCHRDRGWRGMEAPRAPAAPGEVAAADGKRYLYVCDHCRAPFETRQALGGHRASHNGKKGCSWLSKHAMELADAAAAASTKPYKFAWDLNDPAPEE